MSSILTQVMARSSPEDKFLLVTRLNGKGLSLRQGVT
jgi:magnesium-transporting ATPase (P-type)